MVVFIELDFDELAESGRVVIPGGLRVADRLHDRRRGENLLLDLRFRCRTADGCEIPHRVLRGDRFASARLAGDNNRLVMVLSKLKDKKSNFI